MEPIYLDHNSTTPVLPLVVEAMRPFWSETFGNPASAHAAGRRARQALEEAREQIAELLGADPTEVIFTSGATEANNLAIFGLAGAAPGRIVASPIEHPSVLEPVDVLRRRGFETAFAGVTSEGLVCTRSFLSSIDDASQLATTMLANHETGAVQPIQELCGSWRDRRGDLPFHCDAAQAVGKMPIRFHALGVTSLSLSGHKLNGPRGIGALLLRKRVAIGPQLRGGHQQQGRRPGTEPVALIVGLAKALSLACQEMTERRHKLNRLRGLFLKQLTRSADPVHVNGSLEGLPGTLNLSFPGCSATVLLMKLDLVGVSCSAGSACSSGSLLPSPVLRAMGCSPSLLTSALRFSFSHLQADSEIAEAAARTARVVEEARSTAN